MCSSSVLFTRAGPRVSVADWETTGAVACLQGRADVDMGLPWYSAFMVVQTKDGLV